MTEVTCDCNAYGSIFTIIVEYFVNSVKSNTGVSHGFLHFLPPAKITVIFPQWKCFDLFIWPNISGEDVFIVPVQVLLHQLLDEGQICKVRYSVRLSFSAHMMKSNCQNENLLDNIYNTSAPFMNPKY